MSILINKCFSIASAGLRFVVVSDREGGVQIVVVREKRSHPASTETRFESRHSDSCTVIRVEGGEAKSPFSRQMHSESSHEGLLMICTNMSAFAAAALPEIVIVSCEYKTTQNFQVRCCLESIFFRIRRFSAIVAIGFTAAASGRCCKLLPVLNREKPP
ncbi:hypothetical protein [uncultured Jannaschia sp.]|uniref:hypothetical protein n=1 Tax=uncultured Jannaschia sp. TaxID=293347 RepID=UPI00260A6C51|nr:hypothetical protein [uncultured Jannaschia sp.]